MSWWDKITGKQQKNTPEKKNFWSGFRKGLVRGLAVTAVCVGGAAVGGPVGFVAALGGVAVTGMALEAKKKNKFFKAQKQKIESDKTLSAAQKEKELKQLKMQRISSIIDTFGLTPTSAIAAMAHTSAKVQAKKEAAKVTAQPQSARATTQEVANVVNFVRKNTYQK